MVTTDRSTSNVPGATGRYWYGDASDEHLFLWRGPANRPNMPCIVYIKPGHAFNPGERVMDPHTSGTFIGAAIDDIYNLAGWPIVSLEFRRPCSVDSPIREEFDIRPWPGPILSVAKAMRHLREHYDDENLWGTGGSIDPGRILVMGASSGGLMALLLASIPPAAFGIGTNVLGQYDDVQDHRPNAVCTSIAQTDWTQFAFDPDADSGAFAFDKHQYFYGQESSFTNTAFSRAPKRSASPWWWREFIDPKRTIFYGAWGDLPSVGVQKELDPRVDWIPGRIASDEDAQKAFYDPHHAYQALPWLQELDRMGVTHRYIWGRNETNPGALNNDTVPNLGPDFVDWILNKQGWPVVYAPGS